MMKINTRIGDILKKYLIDNETNFKKSILLFPYAGGGSNVYKNWIKAFDNFNIIRLLYPGREGRFNESPVDNMEDLICLVYEEMIENFNFDNEYYLFGHSMGTKVVYELALKIKHNDDLPNPKAVIISAGRAPNFKEKKPIYHLDEKGFIKGLRSYGGTPKEVLENKDLMRMFLPMLRADFSIDEEYQDFHREKIDSPILSLMGTNDKQIELDELLEWRNYTNKEFYIEYIRGGHMFIIDNSEEVILKVKDFINGL